MVLRLGRETLVIEVEALDSMLVPAIKDVAIILLNIWKAYELVKVSSIRSYRGFLTAWNQRNKSYCHRLVRQCHHAMNFVHEHITISTVQSDHNYLVLPLECLEG